MCVLQEDILATGTEDPKLSPYRMPPMPPPKAVAAAPGARKLSRKLLPDWSSEIATVDQVDSSDLHAICSYSAKATGLQFKFEICTH